MWYLWKGLVIGGRGVDKEQRCETKSIDKRKRKDHDRGGEGRRDDKIPVAALPPLMSYTIMNAL